MTTYLAVLRSMCCDAPVIVAGRTTRHSECGRCGMPCDAERQDGGADE